MASQTRRNLARKLNRPPAETRNSPTGPWIVGTVVAVSLSTNSLTVTIHGDATQIPGVSFLDSYNPVVGDNVTIVRVRQHLWVVGSVAGSYAPIVGPGASTNVIPGGANRTNTEPFQYWASEVVATTGVSGWSYTTSGYDFTGCGAVNVTPGDNAPSGNNLAFLSLIQANCLISGGNLMLNGAAFTSKVTATVSGSTATGTINGVPGSSNIRINISAVGW